MVVLIACPPCWSSGSVPVCGLEQMRPRLADGWCAGKRGVSAPDGRAEPAFSGSFPTRRLRPPVSLASNHEHRRRAMTETSTTSTGTERRAPLSSCHVRRPGGADRDVAGPGRCGGRSPRVDGRRRPVAHDRRPRRRDHGAAAGRVAGRLGLGRRLLAASALLALGSLASAAAPSFLLLALAQVPVGVAVAALTTSGTLAAAEWVPPSCGRGRSPGRSSARPPPGSSACR